jgi:exodeoxyribonuclease V alpha subunit
VTASRTTAPPQLGLQAAAGATTLEGVLERVTYAQQDTGWSVVRLAVPGRRELVTAVGDLPGVQPGENLRLRGRWTVDARWGQQFRVESWAAVQPATLVGVEKYLGSGLVRGIGPVMAKRLVEHFGLATLDVIESDSRRLQEVEGIGPVRSARITQAWLEQKQIKDVMVFLQAHGVSTVYAIRIYKHYGQRAIEEVRANPYRLALDIFGIGFHTADRIAEQLGIARGSAERAQAGVLHALGELAGEGHMFCPRRALVETTARLLELDSLPVDQAIGALAAAGQVVLAPLEPAQPGAAASESDQPVYLAALHAAESGSAALARALLDCPVRPIAIDVERALAWFEQRQGIALAPEQRQAIRAAVHGKLLVVTGGPGTGKTTLLRGILEILERKQRRIALAAPTGRAARRLAEATGREARTLHRLLEFDPRTRGFARNAGRPLEVDLAIVDESSMLDAVLAYHLLKALPPAAQLVLVGDVDQLPSVGPGSVLREVIRSGAAQVVRLSHIFRQAQASAIVVSAHRVNRGELPELTPPEAERDARDFFFVEKSEPEQILEALKRLVSERIPAKFGLNPVEDVQVLTPMHRGLLGAAHLNAELQALLNPGGAAVARGSRLFRIGDKVMQVRNNYELDVFNGDIGRIEALDEVERALEVRFDGRRVAYDAADLDELVLAYACSIHKAQGSEYPCVVLPLHTQHYALLQRNLLYTAITRGRRLVVVVGSRRALAIAVRNDRIEQRHTRLAALLRR